MQAFFSFWQFKLFYVCITVHVINVATDLFGGYKGSYLLPWLLLRKSRSALQSVSAQDHLWNSALLML